MRDAAGHTESLLVAARAEAARWARLWGPCFAVRSGARTASPAVTLPDGTQIHRSHLLFMRSRGIVYFEHLGPGCRVAVE